ncbi:helix-turn-helix domain-containing protein [Sphingobacterium sp. Lzh-3]|uniref:helix-turn-helix domain-containing protein n=1 Tax=Sphingobacterium sp. Lzh-3 TaxID=3382150 RepID=UPI00398CB536
MMLNSKSIGNKIAEARKRINLSQAELALQISISPQAVGKWERGESMPDIITLNRLAEIFTVDLNYFSESFHKNLTDPKEQESSHPNHHLTDIGSKSENQAGRHWNMSKGNWENADFSGLKNLEEQFSSSNIKNCKFTNADLSGLILSKNNIELCDFSSSNLTNSKIQSSNLLKNQFNQCSFRDANFSRSNIGQCNFSDADLTGAIFDTGYFEHNEMTNTLLKCTSFINTGVSDVIFEGRIEDCHFEGCGFYKVKFQRAIILNTFFKYNRKLKKVTFVDCKVDSLTYAFLKNNEANLTGITLLD